MPTCGSLAAGTISTFYRSSGGSSVLTNRDLGAIRLDSTGVDETYATDGVAKVDLGIQPDGTPTTGLGQNQGPTAVTVAHGEVVFAIGPMWNPGGMLGRLGPDGLLDPTFDEDGLVAVPAVPEVYTGLAVDGNRKIVAAVGDGISAALRRFGPDGSVDTGFGTNGRVQMAQVAPQLLSPTVSIPLSQIHVLYGHTEQAGGSVRLLRVASQPARSGDGLALVAHDGVDEIFLGDPEHGPVDQRAEHRAGDRRQPEQPELLDVVATGEEGRGGRSGRVDGRVGDGDRDEVDQREREPDGHRCGAVGCALAGGAHDHQEEGRGHDHLAHAGGQQVVAPRRQVVEPVRREAVAGREAVDARGDHPEHPSAGDAPDDLGGDVAQGVGDAKRRPATSPSVTAGLKCPPDTWPSM